ncbi:MAG: sigma-54-dependent Fis family transcriptional regulator [Myxococcales bacterium]|nr:sigma-54-dependent Fis family transcriptional regulator [Myxococcales bacterium]
MIGVVVSSVQLQSRILVVEDDAATRHGVAAALRARGHAVLEAGSCHEALALFSPPPDAVITDLRLPDGDAVRLLPQLHALDATVPVFIITGFATIDVAVRAVKLGAEDFFTKPVVMTTLIDFVEKAVARRRSTTTGKHVRASVAARESRSEVMRRLDDEVERLRNSDCTVLILGETGTGKSVLARHIHDVGARSNGPFVDVNCAGLRSDFVESELFGHLRGAFTGAHAQKQGLFDAAHDGTLFLDEIGDIDMQVQPKILKVLEEKRFRRMGEVRERNADIRLIAATHHDLLASVERRTFRADLFYRISTVTVRVPSLRERTEDIPGLVAQLLAQEGLPDVSPTREAWEKLASYSWPGNIRELKNVIHRALILRTGTVIAADDVRFDSESRSSLLAAPAESTSSRTLEEVEREHIARALAAENGRVRDAARRLAIPRSTLYQKIKNYGIPLSSRPRSLTDPPEEG